MQGLCIQETISTNLKKGETYYLIPHGGNSFHASKFPTPGSHFGTYQRDRFKIIEVVDEWPSEPDQRVESPQLEKGKVYKAELIWRKKGYSYNTPLGMYFIAAIDNGYACDTDCYFYKDAALQKPQGRFPLHWFTNIQEYDEKVIVELPRNEWQQMDLFSL